MKKLLMILALIPSLADASCFIGHYFQNYQTGVVFSNICRSEPYYGLTNYAPVDTPCFVYINGMRFTGFVVADR